MLGLSFKTGTDDLRESPLVILAEQLIGKGIKLSIYDPDVQLSRLLGANRRFIETQLPHIGDLLVADPARMIGSAEMLVVGVSTPAILDALATHARPEHQLIDLVGLSDNGTIRANMYGLCW